MTPFGKIGKEQCMPSEESISIHLNGNLIRFNSNDTIQIAINYLKPDSPFVAAELNGEIIDKPEFDKITLKNNDILEIIQPLGGGSR